MSNPFKLIEKKKRNKRCETHLPPLLTQFNDSNVFMGVHTGARACVCVRHQSAVLLKHCLSQHCETTLAHRSILRVPLQQLEGVRVQESRCVMLVRVPLVSHLQSIRVFSFSAECFGIHCRWSAHLQLSWSSFQVGTFLYFVANLAEVRVEQQSQVEEIWS